MLWQDPWFWARRASLRQPLWLAVSIGVGCILIGLVGGINVHQASGILLFPLLFAVIDVVLLVAVTYGQSALPATAIRS